MFRSLTFNLAVLTALTAIPFVVRAQAVITTKNASISADVSHDGSGLISIYSTGTSPKAYVSYPEQSFLSVLVNGVIYTNNSNLPDTLPPAFPSTPVVLLDNGVDTVLQYPDGDDTIRTTWSTTGDFDIIQDVYPVLFRNGGQIVIRIKAVNHSSNVLSVQTQYLLDVDITGVNFDGTPFSSDNAKIATEFGYTSVCQTFSQTYTSIVPPFFLAFQWDLGLLQFPGNIACGFLNDTFSEQPLGLIQPSTFTIVDWPTIAETYSWGWPSDLIEDTYNDEAILIQWPLARINPRPSGDTAVEIARTCYGTGGYTECNSNIAAFSFYSYLQHEFFYPQNGLLFPVTSLIFNKSVNDTFNDVKATLSVDSFFKIVGPSPVLDGGLIQTQQANPSSILPKSMGKATWVDTLRQDSYQDTSSMLLSVSADEINIHGNVVVLQEVSNCPLDILPIGSGDVIPPTIIFISRDGSFNGSICNARCSNMSTKDSGIDESGIQSIDASSISNMQLILSKIDTLDRASVFYSVCVIDSMQNGYATVTVTDQAGNSDSTNFTYCTIPDTLAPLIVLASDNKDITFSIEENRPWDRGIDSIVIISDTNYNVIFNPPNNWKGLPTVRVSATPTDTDKRAELCLEISDLAGNKLDTCFNFIPVAPEGVDLETDQSISLIVLPNPSEDRFEIDLNTSPGTFNAFPQAEGDILDLLGRTVAKFTFTGRYIFDASGLPSGTYILHAVVGQPGKNQHLVTKRIIKE